MLVVRFSLTQAIIANLHLIVYTVYPGILFTLFQTDTLVYFNKNIEQNSQVHNPV